MALRLESIVDRRVVAAVVLVVGPLLVAWLVPGADRAGPCVPAGEPVLLPDLPESSGLALSARVPGLLWSHNDSGNAAVLFAIDAADGIRQRVTVPIRTRDWEDVSIGPCPSGSCLFIADIGDNQRQRPNVRIYRVPEPAPDDTETAPPLTYVASYEDGPHNAEGMFVTPGVAFIVTRDRVGAVYRTALPADGGALEFRRVGQLDLEAVTDAETSRDGATVVVRTSHEAVLYRTADVLRGLFVPYLRVPIASSWEPQGEGVALDGNVLYLSSEGGPWNGAGRLLRLTCRLPG